MLARVDAHMRIKNLRTCPICGSEKSNRSNMRYHLVSCVKKHNLPAADAEKTLEEIWPLKRGTKRAAPSGEQER